MVKTIFIAALSICFCNALYSQESRIVYRSHIVYGYGQSLDRAVQDASRYGIDKNSPSTIRTIDINKPIITVAREVIKTEMAPNLHQQLLYNRALFGQ